MEFRSIALRSDFIFHRFNGEITPRADYCRVETASNPGYYCGNMLIFAEHAPAQGLAELEALFTREFAHNPAILHRSFAWDGVDGRIFAEAELRAAGYHIESSVALTCDRAVAPAKLDRSLMVRPLADDVDWELALDLQVLTREPFFPFDTYVIYKRDQMRNYRRLCETGRGAWFAVFEDGRMLGNLGIFAEGGVGRFQMVVTHPDARRRGVCSTLVYEAARYGFEALGARELVMVADPDYHAARIYESVGFARRELGKAAQWWVK